MKTHAISALVLGGLALVPAAAGRQEASGLAPETKAALDLLFELSQQHLGVRQSVRTVRLEGGDGAPLPVGHPYRPLHDLALRGEVGSYSHEIVGRWAPGQMSTVGFSDSLATGGETGVPLVAFYWAGSLGVRVNFAQNHSRVFTRFEAFDVQVWPQELHGYVGVTPLSALAAYAKATGMLEVAELEGGRLRLRFPCNPEFSAEFLAVRAAEEVPWIEVDVALEPRPRIVRQAYWTELWGIHDEFVPTAWTESSGLALPTAFDYRVNLAPYPDLDGEGFLVFRIEHDLAHAGVDGATIFDLVRAVGFFASKSQYLASTVGGDRLVQEAVDVLSGAAEWGAPGSSVDDDLRASARSILSSAEARIRADGPTWPGLSDEALLEHLVLPMAPFDTQERFCSQMGATVLRRLAGEGVTFAEVLRAYPGDRLSVNEIVDCLRSGGLAYSAVRAETIERRCDERPFLLLLGSDPEAGHLAVARRGEDGGFRVWSAPNELQTVDAGSLSALGRLGVYVVPTEWEEAGSRRFVLPAAGCVLVLALALGAGRRFQKRPSPALGLLLAAAILPLLGCRPAEAASEGEVVLVEAAQPGYRIDVRLTATRSFEVEVRNTSTSDVRILAVMPSCTCLVYRGEKELALPRGGSTRLTLSVTGTSLGEDRERLDLVAAAGGKTHTLPIPILVNTVGPLYTQPDVLQWRGPAGALIEPFEVIAVTDPDEAVGQLEWEVDLEGTRLRLLGTASSATYAGTAHAFRLEGELPPLEPGMYVANVEFTVPRPAQDGEDQGAAVERLRKQVPVMITR